MHRRVLVVDDSPTIRKVVSTILAEHDMEALGAEDGEAALRLLEREDVDLVLTDFVMPRMNGYQLCRELQGRGITRDVPVVLMSAKGDKLRAKFVEQAGATDAITKPFDPMALIAVIEGALSKHERASQNPPDAFTDLDGDAVLLPEDEPGGALAPLRPAEFEFSEDPVERRGQIVERFREVLARIMVGALKQVPAVGGGAGSRPGQGAAVPADEKAALALFGSLLTDDRVARLASLVEQLGKEGESVVLAGDLSFISIAEILQLLELQRQTGALGITTGESEVVLYVRQGMLDLATSSGLPVGFRLGRFLVQTGVLTRERLRELLEATKACQGSHRLTGEALVHAGLATEEQVRDALRRQTEELVYEVVRWSSGRFQFRREASSPEATLAHLGAATSGMVMEGFRRVDEWQLIEGSFDFSDVLERAATTTGRLIPPTELTDTERGVLEAVNGKRTVRQIVDETEAGTFDVCKVIYQLLRSRAVRKAA